MPGASNLKIFVPINKIDEEQRLVYGQVAAEVLDNSGEMFDYEGSKEYFQKWSENAHATSGGKSYGNVRVMHTSKVAGVVSSPLGFDDDNRVIEACAKVIDDGEWAMVKAGGYTGFSMGGRYVSRATKSDGVKTYIADPVEISLVDKPCIPTATFSVVKADGLTETRRFREDLYKSDAGESSMYVPTNDEVLPVAKELAKAAGRPDAWVEFFEQASADLVAKHDEALAKGFPGAEEEDAKEKDKTEGETEGETDETDETDETGETDGGKEDAKEKDAEDEESGETEKEDDKAKKADFADLQQGWRAKDGSFHILKADASARNDVIAKGEQAPTLSERLEGIRKMAEGVLSGETEDEGHADATQKADTVAAIAVPLSRLKDYADNVLVKGMYGIRRLAEIIASLDELHCMVTMEEVWEEDGSSTLPDALLSSLTSLGQSLIAMANEEVNEMIAMSVAYDKRSTGVEVMDVDSSIVELASATLGLEKAAFVTGILGRVDLMKADKAPATPEEPSSDILAKVDRLTGENAELVKRADAAESELAKMEPLINKLQADITAIKAMPREKAPTTRVVAKGDDVSTGSTEPAAAPPMDLSKFSRDELADAAIRLSHQHGRNIALPSG